METEEFEERKKGREKRRKLSTHGSCQKSAPMPTTNLC